MGRGVLAMLLAGMALPVPALAKEAVQAAAPASESQPRLDLSGPWRFAIARDEAAIRALEDFARPGFDAARFDTIPVPSNWSLLGYESAHYKPFKSGETAGEGFYLKTFTLPADWQGQRILLHFDGVWSSAEVWLNGRAMGRHDSGYTPYVLDIGDALKPGENVLAVRVRQIQHDYLFDTNDDWTLPGIYRPVWLEQTPPGRWIDRVETQTHFDSAFAMPTFRCGSWWGIAISRSPPATSPIRARSPTPCG
jgi:beta-galactosidase